MQKGKARNTDSQGNLDLCFQIIRDASQFQKKFYWHQKIAKARNAKGQVNLGWCCRNGQCVCWMITEKCSLVSKKAEAEMFRVKIILTSLPFGVAGYQQSPITDCPMYSVNWAEERHTPNSTKVKAFLKKERFFDPKKLRCFLGLFTL